MRTLSRRYFDHFVFEGLRCEALGFSGVCDLPIQMTVRIHLANENDSYKGQILLFMVLTQDLQSLRTGEGWFFVMQFCFSTRDLFIFDPIHCINYKKKSNLKFLDHCSPSSLLSRCLHISSLIKVSRGGDLVHPKPLYMGITHHTNRSKIKKW